MMHETRSDDTAIRDAALLIMDEEVADVPEVVEARKALDAAADGYEAASSYYLHASSRMRALDDELAEARAEVAAAKAKLEDVALAVTDGKVPPSAFDDLLSSIKAKRRNVKRIKRAMPGIEARLRDSRTPEDPTADDVASAEFALRTAIAHAKLELATARYHHETDDRPCREAPSSRRSTGTQLPVDDDAWLDG